MITEVINSFLNVRNKVKDVNGNWIDQKEKDERLFTRSDYNVNIPSSNGVVNIINRFDVKIVIDSLVYNATTRVNNYSLYPYLSTLKNGSVTTLSNNLFHIVDTGETNNRVHPQPKNIDDNYSDYLEVIVKDDRYQDDSDDPRVNRIISLKKPIILPKGCVLSLVNPTSTTLNTTYKVIYREFEV